MPAKQEKPLDFFSSLLLFCTDKKVTKKTAKNE